MFGESGGEFKLETPDASDYIYDYAQFANDTEEFEYVPNDNYFASGPAGTALVPETSEDDTHGWFFSGTP